MTQVRACGRRLASPRRGGLRAPPAPRPLPRRRPRGGGSPCAGGPGCPCARPRSPPARRCGTHRLAASRGRASRSLRPRGLVSGPARRRGRRLTPAAGAPGPCGSAGDRQAFCSRAAAGEGRIRTRGLPAALSPGASTGLFPQQPRAFPELPGRNDPCVAKGQKRCQTVPRRAEDRSRSSPPRVTLGVSGFEASRRDPRRGRGVQPRSFRCQKDVWKGRKC